MADRSHVSVPHLFPIYCLASRRIRPQVRRGRKCVGRAFLQVRAQLGKTRQSRSIAGRGTRGREFEISLEAARSSQRRGPWRAAPTNGEVRCGEGPRGRRAHSSCSRRAPRGRPAGGALVFAYERDFGARRRSGRRAGRGLHCRPAGAGDQGADGGADVVALVVRQLDERRGGWLSMARRPARQARAELAD